MKISNGKKELARIISENGGWRDMAESAAQSKSGNAVSFYRDIPDRDGDCWWGEHLDGLDISQDRLIANWHQTILSRDEYFHLHPAPNAKPEFCESVMRSIPEPETKPTIEQLAADYRSAKDYAERKQREADAARADADERLKALEIAGEAIGLPVSPITAKQEPWLVITVQAGDEVECVESNINRDKYNGMAGTVLDVDDSSTPYLVDFGGSAKIWCYKVKFIRRP